jgi:hypothetical protein
MVNRIILMGMAQGRQMLAIESLAVLAAAMAFVALRNDWSSFGIWIVSQRCEADLVTQVHVHEDGTRHTHAHFVRSARHSYVLDLRDELPAESADAAPLHVLPATSKAARQRGWLPPDCD